MTTAVAVPVFRNFQPPGETDFGSVDACPAVPAGQKFTLAQATEALLARALALPIFDVHTHFDEALIAGNGNFRTATELFLRMTTPDGTTVGDHYVWTQLRHFGVSDGQIFGRSRTESARGASDAGSAAPDPRLSDEALFVKFVELLPNMLGNPSTQWAVATAKALFGVDLYKMPPAEAYAAITAKLQQDEFRIIPLLQRQNFAVVCTTDSPLADLETHRMHADKKTGLVMLPTWRPDQVFYVENRGDFRSFVTKLDTLTRDLRGGREIDSYGQLLLALEKRAEFFKARGCQMADHGPDNIYFPAELKNMSRTQVLVKMTQLLARAQAPGPDGTLTAAEVCFFKAVMQQDLCRLNAKMGWTQQLHIGPFRRINTVATAEFGADRGYDAMGDEVDNRALASLFDSLRGADSDALARTVVYALNPNSWRQVYTTCLRFPKDGSEAHCTLGFPWWFNDQEAGLRDYLTLMETFGNISTVPGMVCDGRSLAAGVRFAWAREIICQFVAERWFSGKYGDVSLDTVFERIIEPACSKNSRRFVAAALDQAVVA